MGAGAALTGEAPASFVVSGVTGSPVLSLSGAVSQTSAAFAIGLVQQGSSALGFY